jgi:hypothetical protein
MTHTISSPAAARSSQLVVALDFIILLTPPLHWLFGNGDMAWALSYFFGSCILVALSLPLLAALSTYEEK